ncbi:MAG: Maf family nucleotide pyrophosphatase [Prolixibacteraceae bacterium]|nr:Maf family nucleotide pyrophosphatase [Prolixibacteraceae bacterium]
MNNSALTNKLSNYSIILGSQSARRKELFAGLNLPFHVEVREIEENFPAEMSAFDVPEFLSIQKTIPFKDDFKQDVLLITSDTIVLIDNQILGKPSDYKHAFEMLQLLSGRKHMVITGVCITTIDKQITFSDRTDVFFKSLSADEIDYYLTHYQPYDKAGSYGVQEWIGYVAIKKIEGSYFNVMGLPIQRLYEELLKF